MSDPLETRRMTCSIASDDEGYFGMHAEEEGVDVVAFASGGSVGECEKAKQVALFVGGATILEALHVIRGDGIKHVEITIKVDDPQVAAWLAEGGPGDNLDVADSILDIMGDLKEAFGSVKYRYVHPDKNQQARQCLENGKGITDHYLGDDG